MEEEYLRKLLNNQLLPEPSKYQVALHYRNYLLLLNIMQCETRKARELSQKPIVLPTYTYQQKSDISKIYMNPIINISSLPTLLYKTSFCGEKQAAEYISEWFQHASASRLATNQLAWYFVLGRDVRTEPEESSRSKSTTNYQSMLRYKFLAQMF